MEPSGDTPPPKFSRLSGPGVAAAGPELSEHTKQLGEASGDSQVPAWQPTPTRAASSGGLGLPALAASTSPFAPLPGGAHLAVQPSLELQVASLTKLVENLAIMHRDMLLQQSFAAAASRAAFSTAAAAAPLISPIHDGGGAALRSAQVPSAQSDAPMSALEAAVAKVSISVAKTRLPAELLAAIRHEGAKLGKHLRALARTRAMMKKLELRCSELKAGRFPPGTRP